MRRSLIAIAVLLLMFGTVYGAWRYWRTDPDVAAAREVQARLAELGDKATPDERRQLMQQFRASLENLTDEQRRALFRERGDAFGNRMRESVGKYFALPEGQRRAYLDQQINEQEQRRVQMERRMAELRARAGQSGQNGAAMAGERRTPWGDGPRNGGPPGGAGGDGRGGAGGRERRMLDNSTPVERARTTEYFSAMQERRKERGLPVR